MRQKETTMRGNRYSSDKGLSERDMRELADVLALRLHERMGERVYMLTRSDVVELVAPYIDDLAADDQRALPWLVWHLFQDALEAELQGW
jgi:hypothetical protein